MTTTTKTKVVENILKITKKAGESKYFDRLIDKEEAYLDKLLVTCKNLKKAK